MRLLFIWLEWTAKAEEDFELEEENLWKTTSLRTSCSKRATSSCKFYNFLCFYVFHGKFELVWKPLIAFWRILKIFSAMFPVWIYFLNRKEHYLFSNDKNVAIRMYSCRALSVTLLGFFWQLRFKSLLVLAKSAFAKLYPSTVLVNLCPKKLTYRINSIWDKPSIPVSSKMWTRPASRSFRLWRSFGSLLVS